MQYHLYKEQYSELETTMDRFLKLLETLRDTDNCCGHNKETRVRKQQEVPGLLNKMTNIYMSQ